MRNNFFNFIKLVYVPTCEVGWQIVFFLNCYIFQMRRALSNNRIFTGYPRITLIYMLIYVIFQFLLTFFGVDDCLYSYPQIAFHVSFLIHYGHLVNEWNRVQEIRQVYKAPVGQSYT